MHITFVPSPFSIFIDKQTFPDLEFVGFYVTAEHNRITPEDDIVQHQAMQINESPFLLKFNAFDPVDCDKVSVYYSNSK